MKNCTLKSMEGAFNKNPIPVKQLDLIIKDKLILMEHYLKISDKESVKRIIEELKFETINMPIVQIELNNGI